MMAWRFFTGFLCSKASTITSLGVDFALRCSVLFKNLRRSSYVCCSPFCLNNSKIDMLLAHGWYFLASLLYIYRMVESVSKRLDEFQTELCGWLFLFKSLPRYHHECGSARVFSKSQNRCMMSAVLALLWSRSLKNISTMHLWLALWIFLYIQTVQYYLKCHDQIRLIELCCWLLCSKITSICFYGLDSAQSWIKLESETNDICCSLLWSNILKIFR